MAELLGIEGDAAQQIYSKIESGKTKRVSPDIIQKFRDLKGLPPNTAEPAISGFGKIQKNTAKTDNNEQNISINTINMLAQSNYQIAESNASLSRSNERLVQIVEANSSASSKSFVQDPAFVEFVHLIAKVAVGQKWKSEDEFLAFAMGKLKPLPLKVK